MATLYRITNPKGEVRDGLTRQDVSNFKAAKGGHVPEGYVLESYEESETPTAPVQNTENGKISYVPDAERTKAYGGWAKMFPYTVGASMSGKEPGFIEGLKDMSSLPGRFITSGGGLVGSLGKTSEESDYDSVPGLVAGVARNPYVGMSVAAAPIVTAAIESLGLPLIPTIMANLGTQFNVGALLNGIEGYTHPVGIEDNRTNEERGWDLIKAGAFSAAGEGVAKLLSKGANAYRAKDLANTKSFYDKNERIIANIIARGTDKNVPLDIKKKIQEYYRPVVDQLMKTGLDEEKIEEIILSSGKKLDDFSASPVNVEGEALGPGVYRKPKSIPVSSVGRQLSKEELKLIQEVSASNEELAQNIKAATEAKAQGQDILSAIQARKNFARETQAANQSALEQNTEQVAREKGLEANLNQGVADEANQQALTANKTSIQDIQRTEEQFMKFDQIYDWEQNIEEAYREVSKALDEGKLDRASELMDLIEQAQAELNEGIAVVKGSPVIVDMANGVMEDNPYSKGLMERVGQYEGYAENAANEAKKVAYDNAVEGTKRKFSGEADWGYYARMYDDKLKEVEKKNSEMEQKVASAKARLQAAQEKLQTEGKSSRGKNIENGYRQLGENGASNMPAITTNKYSEDFSKKLLENLEKAEAETNSSITIENGRPAISYSGKIIPPSDSRDVIRARDVANQFYALVENRAKAKGLGVSSVKDPQIYNEDVRYIVEELVQTNNYPFAKAVLNSCDWLSAKEKSEILSSTMNKKFYQNYLNSNFKPVGEIKHLGGDRSIYGIARSVPFLTAAIPSKEKLVTHANLNDVYNAWAKIQKAKGRKDFKSNGLLASTGYGLNQMVRGDQK